MTVTQQDSELPTPKAEKVNIDESNEKKKLGRSVSPPGKLIN
jgi:hypothetical protein